jgi:hypothetical protein
MEARKIKRPLTHAVPLMAPAAYPNSHGVQNRNAPSARLMMSRMASLADLGRNRNIGDLIILAIDCPSIRPPAFPKA